MRAHPGACAREKLSRMLVRGRGPESSFHDHLTGECVVDRVFKNNTAWCLCQTLQNSRSRNPFAYIKPIIGVVFSEDRLAYLTHRVVVFLHRKTRDVTYTHILVRSAILHVR